MQSFKPFSYCCLALMFHFCLASTTTAQHIITDATTSVNVNASTTKANPITSIDFVKIKNGHVEETLFYYENNWKVLREIALDKGYIHSYQLLQTLNDENTDFDLMLMTVYKDAAQHEKSERNFREIIDARQEGLTLLNELKPSDFRENVFFKDMRKVAEK